MLRVKKCKTETEWKQSRVIGGTDVSAILGLNPYKTPLDVYSKLVKGREKEVKMNEAMQRGKDFEPLVRDGFTLDYKNTYKVIAPPKTGNWLYWRSERPYLTATPDARLIRLEDGAKGVLEIKTVDIRRATQASDWENGLLPNNYYCQCLAYISVLKVKFVILRARIRYYYGGKLERVEIKDYYIDATEKQEDVKKLETAVDRFWNYNVQKKHYPKITIKGAI